MSGPAIRLWFRMSGVGVRMAAMTKLIRIAYFRFFERNCGVTSPIRDSMVSASGSSKTRPKASVNLMMKSTWLDTEIIGWMPWSLPKLSRN